jgi:hypothetical protein
LPFELGGLPPPDRPGSAGSWSETPNRSLKD